MAKSSVDDVKKMLRKKDQPIIQRPQSFLSTGSALLNLACSGSARKGFPVGKYIYLVGDSMSGKTWLSLTCMAEASITKEFDDYRFIYDSPEGGASMDVARFFGDRVAERLEAPAKDKDGTPIHSSTAEEFYYHVDDAIAADKPFIYVLDSMDALDTDDDEAKFRERKAAKNAGREVKGSYGMSKAKANSVNLRRVRSFLHTEGQSILIIISQTRDNVSGFGFETKTRAGGKALRFYADLEMWSSVEEKIKKTVRGKPRHLGSMCRVKIKKNRITGRETEVRIPIYFSIGMDDLGGCVKYLIDEGHWSMTKGSVNAVEFKLHGPPESLVRNIEKDGLESKLHALVGQVWADIEDGCRLERKRRYD